MHRTKDTEKRSRSPTMRADEPAEVRERTPLSHSEGSQSETGASGEEPELPVLPPCSKDPISSAALKGQEPTMPYFLQLSDMGIPSLFLTVNVISLTLSRYQSEVL